MGSPESRVRDLEVADLLEQAFAKLPPIPTIQPEGAAPSAEARPAPKKEETPAAAPTPPAPAKEEATLVTPVPSDDVPAVRFVMPGRKS
jgi:hypothetical protein